MDDTQLRLVVIVLLDAAPPLFALLATALAWRSMSRRGLFFVVAVLCLYGLAATIHPMALDYFYPDRLSPVSVAPNYFRALVITDVLTAIFGFPILWWLRNGLRRT
jgi:hypothetical protein